MICYVEEFPDWIKKLENVTTLVIANLGENKVIPDSILQLKSLETVYVNGNITSYKMTANVKKFLMEKKKKWLSKEKWAEKRLYFDDLPTNK